MVELFNNSHMQLFIVAIAINFMSAFAAIYLWLKGRQELYLFYWALAWFSGGIHWVLTLIGISNPELKLFILFQLSIIMGCIVLRSYEMLPVIPWNRYRFAAATFALMFLYTYFAHHSTHEFEYNYVRFGALLMFDAICFVIAYQRYRFTGYAFLAVSVFAHSLFVLMGIVLWGKAIATNIVVPLFNMPEALSLVIVAYQIKRFELQATTEEVRQLYVRLSTLEDDERRALHSELHDEIGANLSALSLELDLVGMLLQRQEPELALKQLENPRQITTDTIAKARNLMAELRPPALDDYGLLAALRIMATTKTQQLHLPIDIKGEELQPRPSAVVEGVLYRIVREALINVAKHAKASSACIELEDYDSEFCLSISDDGVGFTMNDPQRIEPGHWGLKNMRERAISIGAKLNIESVPHRGTRITVTVPKVAV